MEHLLNNIKGKQLTGLTFNGNDSIRLEFGRSTLNLYQWPIATTDTGEINDDDPGYRDLLSGLISETVSSINFTEGASLTLAFSKTKIHLSLVEDEESFYFKAAEGDWMVG